MVSEKINVVLIGVELLDAYEGARRDEQPSEAVSSHSEILPGEWALGRWRENGLQASVRN